MKLSSLVSQFNSYLTEGQTLAAIGKFYHDDVSVQENEEAPRVGKSACLESEEENLARILEMKISILNQAISEESQVVFSEYLITFTNKNGKRYKLDEVSVQHWQGNLIIQEKFYYEKIKTD